MLARKKRQIRIIKHETLNNALVSQATSGHVKERTEDSMELLIRGVSGWVTEFKERRRPNPKLRFQALFKES